jgi:sulfite exporter TauE/SafE
MNEVFITSLIIGFAGGVHCLGMCGAIVGILSNNLPEHVQKNPKQVATYQLTYNIGRIFSYATMGLIFASFATILASNIGMGKFEMIMRIFASVMMILIGFFIAGLGNKIINKIETLGQGLWRKLQPLSQRFIPVKNLKNAFLFGFLWGGIPCGLVYSALVLTLTATPVDGFLIMLFFGIGTLPALLAMAGFGFGLTRFLRKGIVQKGFGVMVIMLGIWSLSMPLMHMAKKYSGQKQEHHNQHSHTTSMQTQNMHTPNE